jgi:hypothetical protein
VIIIWCKVSLYVLKLSALSNHNQVPCNRCILKFRPIIRKIQENWGPKITMMKIKFRVNMSSFFTMTAYWWSRLQSGGPQCVKVVFGCEAEQSLLQNEPPPPPIHSRVRFTGYNYACIDFSRTHAWRERDIISLFLTFFHVVNKSGQHF